MTGTPTSRSPDTPLPNDGAPVSWKRNLIFVWLSQFLSICGFSFGMPFAAYYIQELGVRDNVAVKHWTAIFQASAPITMAVMSPLWGMIADRYGRRLMMLRANFGAAVLLFLMGSVPSVGWLIFLRLLQGMLTGTVSAAQTLVAASTPDHRQGTALGTLHTALSSGLMAGAFFGGVCGDVFGYANAFKIGSGLLLVSGLLIVFGVREDFVPPPRPARADAAPRPAFWWRLPVFGPGFSLLIIIFAVSFARRIDMPILPLLVQKLQGGLEGAGTKAGGLFGVAGLSLFIAGPVVGRLVDRFPAPSLLRILALGAAFFMAAMGLAGGFPALYATRFGTVLFAGGMDTALQVWLSRATAKTRRGLAFGWSVTAKCSAWTVSPLVSGWLAGWIETWSTRYGGVDWVFRPNVAVPADLDRFVLARLIHLYALDLRALFVLGSVLLLGVILAVGWAGRRMAARQANHGMTAGDANPDEEDSAF